MIRASVFLALCLATVACAENLIENPGFESGLAGWRKAFGVAAAIDRDVFHSGSASARVSAAGDTCGIDAEELIVGYDIFPGESYRASAWVKSGGVGRGDFGGRVYCYGAKGKVLAMRVFGGLRDGAPPGDWQRVALDLRPGGEHAIPAGTERVVLRFSLWAEDGKCDGTVWVDDVIFEPVGGEGKPSSPPAWLRRSERGTIIILKDDLPADGALSDPDATAEALSRGGFAVNLVTADRLASEGALDPRWVDLVVLPYGGTFPADARDRFLRYVRHGGSFLTLGGLPFERLVRKTDGEWRDVRAVTVAEGRPGATVADFDGDGRVKWALSHAGPDDQMEVERVAPGAADSKGALKLTCRDLQTYTYAGPDARVRPPDAEHSVLCFWARGDADTDQLAVEPRGDDGSRWKKVVPLTAKWRRYALPTSRFLSYATENRGGPGDHLRPEEIASLWFGFTKGMVAGGRHQVWLDDIEWRVPSSGDASPPAPMRPGAEADLTIAAFGQAIAGPPKADFLIPIFAPPQRIEGAWELRASAGQSFLTGMKALRGRFSGYRAQAPTSLPGGRSSRGLSIGGRRTGRLVPLLEAYDRKSDPLGPVGALYLPARKGSGSAAWAFFGVDSADLPSIGGKPFREMLRRVAGIAAGDACLDVPELTFVAERGESKSDSDVTAVLTAKVRGDEAGASTLKLSVTAPIGRGKTAIEERDVRPGQLVSVRVPVSRIGGVHAPRLSVELARDGTALDRVGLAANVKRGFLRLANWLVENQNKDGTYSGVSFQDNRAARGLLGAYEITGEDRYRESAVRWGEEMIRLQREDGGYRMGYGITSKGEACYVADGGEVALAIARLVSYTKGARRERFVRSLRAYMGYRESFRQPNGAIGVGWCLQDYGKRPIAPLDKPTRIFAGERNTYTIGCTLAAACAYARITGDPADKAMAIRDTEWLLEHYTSFSGAAMESAIWAHRFIADAEMKKRIEARLREGFRKRVVDPTDRSWLGGGGRSVLDLDGLVYWLDFIGPDPEVEAAMARWLYALYGSTSTSAAAQLLDGRTLKSTDKRFLCFLAVASADAVQPMVSMVGF